MQNLGMLLVAEEEFSQALPYLEQAYIHNQENKTNIEFIEQFANCYLQIGNIIKAIELLQHAVTINPNKESIQHNLAILYLRNDNYSKAQEHFKFALQLNDNNSTAKHMIAALSGQTTNLAPSEYITNLFDQYAWYYNKHLTETLQYKLPEKFRSLYAKHYNTVTVQNALDLGCGTGLCSVYFRDTAVNLIGADLSKNMLLHAKALDSYDLLIQTDLQKPEFFKIIVSI
jgi:predicted TPR repeat methyltransferase